MSVQRRNGVINVLIGFNYALLHPCLMQTEGILVLIGNRFGGCLAGSHHKVKESLEVVGDNMEVYFVTNSNDDAFLDIIQMAILCLQRQFQLSNMCTLL